MVLLACVAAALFFAYRVIRVLLMEKVKRGSVGVRVFGLINVDLKFGDREEASFPADGRDDGEDANEHPMQQQSAATSSTTGDPPQSP
ncbi:hypothetical protein [Nonomuraea basaltis]|uniref:hypothetical protein n=1 Tax=Nonomuraea basaltis TaxID=2495887 RepID=UPI00110C60E8|nr:hypothetical protein [Nonomuraea basaltis]